MTLGQATTDLEVEGLTSFCWWWWLGGSGWRGEHLAMLFASQMLDVHLGGFYSLLQEAFSGLSHLPGLGGLCAPLGPRCFSVPNVQDCLPCQTVSCLRVVTGSEVQRWCRNTCEKVRKGQMPCEWLVPVLPLPWALLSSLNVSVWNGVDWT